MIDTTPQIEDQLRQQIADAYDELGRVQEGWDAAKDEAKRQRAELARHRAAQVKVMAALGFEGTPGEVAAKAADELATLRRELAEARDETAAAADRLRLLWDATGIERDAAVGFVAGAIRSMVDTARVARTQLRPQLARVEADLADARHDAEHCARERDEAVAETARVRAVYRDALTKLQGAVALLADDTMTRAQWAAQCPEPGDVGDTLAGVARRMLALLPPLDGAATTGPETAHDMSRETESREDAWHSVGCHCERHTALRTPTVAEWGGTS